MGRDIIDGDGNILIGNNVKTGGNDPQNQIVIGANAVSAGNNTVTLGNDGTIIG